MKFGETIKTARLAKRITLREFAKSLGQDPSNWSKVERGQIPPPTDPPLLLAISKLLGMTADEHQGLVDSSAVERFEYPPDLKQDEIMAKMPAFFRAIRGQSYNEDDFKKLVEGVQKIHGRGPRR